MYYDLLNLWRKPSSISEALFFFLIITIIFVLSQLHQNTLIWFNLSFLWLNIMFATLLGLNTIFKQDKINGTIDTILLYPTVILFVYIYKKIIAHYLIKIVPLLLIYLPISLILNIPFNIAFFSLIIFAISSLGLLFLSTINAALISNNSNSNFLQFIIILPLTVPLWLFAFGAIENFMLNKDTSIALAFLIALSTLFIIIGPIFCSFILRYLND